MRLIVKFPSFRQYEKSRVEMNDSIMAIIVGLGIVDTSLPHEKHDKRIADIFDNIKSVERMNVDVGTFRLKILESESHLSIMALPYILSLHEDYIVTCLQLLRISGFVSNTQINDTNASRMHELLTAASGGNIPQELVDEFHILRLIRNSFIHTGGIPNTELLAKEASLSSASRSKWTKLSEVRKEQLIRAGHKIEPCYDEVKIALAVTTEISRHANYILQSRLSRSHWLDIFKEDFVSSHPAKIHTKTLKRKLTTYANSFYGALSFTNTEIEAILLEIEQ